MPRRNLSYNEKLKLINHVDNCGVDSAQNMFKVSRKTILRTVNNQNTIREKIRDGKGRMKRIVEKCNPLDNKLLKYISKMNEKGYPLSAEMICQKAIEIMNNEDFKGSMGWFQKFKKRCQVKFGKLSGESAGTKMAIVDEYKRRVIPNIRKYPPERRFNLDETSIFYRQIPSKSFYISKKPHFGNKLNKERITILLCCNQSGLKMSPLVISKSKNPRSFRGKLNQIREKGILYEANKAAWMVKTIFFNYIYNWHEELKVKQEKVALILDNFSGHKIDEDSFPFIEFFWLPPNTTYFLQPLDSGIIRSLKCKFVRRLIQKISNYFEKEVPLNEITKKNSLYDAVCWLAASWSEVTTATIVNCWLKDGYGDNDNLEESIVDEYIDDEEIDEEEKTIEIIYENLPINAREKPTLVEYMNHLSLDDSVTYLYDLETTSRGL